MPTRSLAALAALLCCALLPALAPAANAAGPRHDAAERAVVRQVNLVRARHGLRALRASRAIARAADRHSADMLARGFLAHASSDGTAFPVRLSRYLRARRVGETLARSTGRLSAARLVALWMGSAGHRAVLLTPGFRRIGLGLRRRGRVIVATADFASRR